MGQAGVPLERSLTMTADAGRGRYARSMEYFDDRRRAESFGEVASDYDAYRPRYPAALIAAIMQAAEAAAETRTQTSSNAATDSGTGTDADPGTVTRSEEHTSELQSRGHLVCRLLRDKKNRSTHSSTVISCIK